MRMYIMDAFTEAAFGGNPAGVVLLEAGQNWPSEELMRKTAAELRYSETAFVRPLTAGGEATGSAASAGDAVVPENGGLAFELRYFTPVAEVELCGHATIGAFCALLDAGLVAEGDCYKAHTLAGVLNVGLQTGGTVMMDMAPPVAIQRIEEPAALARLYQIMGAVAPASEAAKSAEGVDGRLSGLYPEIISTGLPDIILPVDSPVALAALAPDMEALAALSEEYAVTGVHAFALGGGIGGAGGCEKDCGGLGACGRGPTVCSGGPTAYCRNFAPLYGINEEAATGTANGALTYYLYKNGLIGDGAACVFVQGQAMDRPSEICSSIRTLRSPENNENGSCPDVNIRVGGRAAVLVRGRLSL